MSSIESAPATIPATSAGTFTAALTPPVLATVSLSATSQASPQRCPNAKTGANPAHDTRFGSSNTADTSAAARESRIHRIPFCPDDQGPRQAHRSCCEENPPQRSYATLSRVTR